MRLLFDSLLERVGKGGGLKTGRPRSVGRVEIFWTYMDGMVGGLQN